MFTASVHRNLAPRRERFRRRLGLTRHPDSTVLVESRAPAAVRRRDRVFRRALVGADAFAGLLVVGLAWQVFGSEGPGTTALALIPLIVAINAMSGLYSRDELVLRKSTLDEAPALFQAATLTTVVAFLLESGVLATPMGGRLIAFTWLCLTVIALACRVAARAIARHVTVPERCLFVGEASVAARLESKLATNPNVKACFVGRIPLDANPKSLVTGVLGTLRRPAAGRRRAGRTPRDRYGRRRIAPDPARRHPEREGARSRSQRATEDVRGGRILRGVRLP